MTFPEIIASWETFYLLMGTAGATLMGLLFVAVSINIETFRRQAYLDLQYFAALTFNSFFYVLVISLVFLIPRPAPLGIGLPLLVLGLLGFVNTSIQQRRARQVQAGRSTTAIQMRFTITAASLALLALVGLGLMFSLTGFMYLLVVDLILLLGSAAVNAWTLLVQVAPEDAQEEPHPLPTDTPHSARPEN